MLKYFTNYWGMCEFEVSLWFVVNAYKLKSYQYISIFAIIAPSFCKSFNRQIV